MNQPFNTPGQTPQTPPSQNQFQAPQSSVPSNSSPFDSPTPSASVPNGQPMGQMGAAPQAQAGGFEPTNEPMSSPKSSWGLIIALVVVLFLGVLVFASWEGWISLGGIEKLWKKSDTATTTTPAATTATDTINANDTQRKTDLAALKTALTAYYQAQQSYPIAATVQKTSDATNALTVLVPTYIASLPVDPLSPTYYYGYKSDGKTFELMAALEDKTSAGGTQMGSYYIYKITDTSAETPTSTSSSSSTDTTTTDTTTTTTTTTPATSDTSSTGTATGSSSATTTTQ